MVSSASMKAAGEEQVGDARPHHRAVATLLLVAGKRLQLVGDLAVEERGEPRVALDQLERHVLRQHVTQRLLASHEGVTALAVDEGAAVEAVLGTEQRHQIAAVALLDRTLDDHEQGIRRRILGDDGFARAEVGDIQRGAQRLDLLRISR